MRLRWFDRYQRGPAWVYWVTSPSQELLYVGATGVSPQARVAVHRRRSRWWQERSTVVIREFPTLSEALHAEWSAIWIGYPTGNRMRPKRSAPEQFFYESTRRRKAKQTA